MAVQHEVKSQLAKLLATEDILVEHKKVSTAQFNVHTRVLILPLWEKASHDVYDMLVGHEVGHALYTPDQDPPKHIPHQFTNVVEDARIEKLMKRRYMGLAKSFYKGYSELHNQDFFDLDGEDISSFNLADRANLYFKIGSFLDLSFSAPEKEIIDLIHDCETFEDTVSAAEALYNFCKQEQEETVENQQKAQFDFEHDLQDFGDVSGSSSSNSELPVPDTDGSDDLEDRSVRHVNTSGMGASDATVTGASNATVEPEIKTSKSFDSRLKDLVNADGVENVYVTVPEVNLDNVIISNDEVHKEIDSHWVMEEERWKNASEQYDYNLDPGFEECDEEFVEFKRDAQKEVNYLVKEFECKKAASAYARASTSKTGVLDCNNLHTYKFNEDIFKKITVLPDGKNHGLVFILDWSGSMQYVLKDTLKQLYNLIWFCRKVQIPFDVYAFTTEWTRRRYDDYSGELPSLYQVKEYNLSIDENFRLMNVFTHKVNSAVLEHQMINMWRVADSFNRGHYSSRFSYPQRLLLSGTPLNEAIVSLHQILPKFQKENNVEKLQCIILTDGEAHQLPYHKEVKRHWEEEPYMGARSCNPNYCFLRDRKLGRTYKIGYRWTEFTDALLYHLKDKFPFTNFIGIRVLENRDARQFIRMHHGEDEKRFSEWRRNKSFIITNSGYDAYFGLSSLALSQDSEFDVDYDATKAQIKRAFVKSLKTKKLNKKILGEFIELVV